MIAGCLRGLCQEAQAAPDEKRSASAPFTIWFGQGNCLFPITELPEALKRSSKARKPRESKKRYGTSIAKHPKIVSHRVEEGHWDSDTVVGKQNG